MGHAGFIYHQPKPPLLLGSKFNKSWGDAKDKLVSGLAYYLKALRVLP